MTAAPGAFLHGQPAGAAMTYHLRFLYDKRTRLGKPLQPSRAIS